MAQNQNSINSKKIYNCPIRAKINSISHKNSSNTTPKPVQNVHQSQKIPIESESPIVSSHKNKNETVFVPNKLSSAQKAAKPPASSRWNVEKVEAKPPDLVSDAKTKSTKDDGVDEGKDNDKFTDYITKVKDKMRSVSNVGRSATRRDSFNDKVSNYINRAGIKIRTTTTNIGDDKNVSFK
ncbi:hypothetical protein BUALT_Bualt11G0065500 [Buddleja alternifolia]|uniref:Uncharacterized protein n=1 Tax=Buddleja alternifolia TaxID=168488 RepID=A0AAV6X3P1_9LAMI|nr:hypothetical protein BUALT_Bualt11G0065500 [Buddleja alternifolia]